MNAYLQDLGVIRRTLNSCGKMQCRDEEDEDPITHVPEAFGTHAWARVSFLLKHAPLYPFRVVSNLWRRALTGAMQSWLL